jgi:acetyl-CoA carboxylase biotin carboxyl carrier protein
VSYKRIEKLVRIVEESEIDSLIITHYLIPFVDIIPIYRIEIAKRRNGSPGPSVEQQKDYETQQNPGQTINPTQPDTNDVESEKPFMDGIDESTLTAIVANHVGKCRVINPATKEPYVNIGDKIKKDQVIFSLDYLSNTTEVKSEYDGTIVRILREDDEPVDFGLPIYLIQEDKPVGPITPEKQELRKRARQFYEAAKKKMRKTEKTKTKNQST